MLLGRPSLLLLARNLVDKTTESQSLEFRVLDFDQPDIIAPALEGVDEFLFVSSSERDNAKRITQHRNVVDAAKRARVGRVWYVSLAFGGYGDRSKIGFQTAHYETEDLLQASGLGFVSLRAGVYADAFPLFLNWYPSGSVIQLPHLTPSVEEGNIAFTSHDELGEAIATLLSHGLEAFPEVKPQGEKNILLLTGPEAESLHTLAEVIGRATGHGESLEIKYLEPETWVAESAKDDEGGKPKAWFEACLTFFQGLCDGNATTVDIALEKISERRLDTGSQAVRRLVKKSVGGV